MQKLHNEGPDVRLALSLYDSQFSTYTDSQTHIHYVQREEGVAVFSQKNAV